MPYVAEQRAGECDSTLVKKAMSLIRFFKSEETLVSIYPVKYSCQSEIWAKYCNSYDTDLLLFQNLQLRGSRPREGYFHVNFQQISSIYAFIDGNKLSAAARWLKAGITSTSSHIHTLTCGSLSWSIGDGAALHGATPDR